MDDGTTTHDEFDLYRQTLSSNLPIFEVPKLDRDTLLADHTAVMAREYALNQRKEVRTRRVLIGGANKHYSRANAIQLQNGRLQGFKCNEIALGQILICRVISDAVRTASVQLIVEDSEGWVAPVHMYYVSSRHTSIELNELYPRGAIFAIREPSIKESRGGFLIRIDSPSDLIRLYSSSPLLFSNGQRLFPLDNRSAQQYKDAGNRHFSDRKWIKAFEAYSFGIDLENRSGSLSTVLRSNRAMTALHLRRNGQALQDCIIALQDDDLFDSGMKKKILFRAATAEYNLLQFDESVARLQHCLKIDPNDVDARNLVGRSLARLEEKRTGIYDWGRLFSSTSALDIAEYVGPVEVKDMKGKGKGLVATRDIGVGELLLVSKPLAMGRGHREDLTFTVGMNLLTETVDPYPFVELISILVERAMDEKSFYGQVMELHSGRPASSSADASSIIDADADSSYIDINHFEAAATFNSFHTESLGHSASRSNDDDDDGINIHASSSLYHLPSRMNHSCIGNVSYTFISDVICLRAKSIIRKGEECTDSYVDSLDELDSRNEKLVKHGFVCDCELCTWDRKDGDGSRKERAKLSEQVQVMTGKIHGNEQKSAASHISTMLSIIDKILSTYSIDRPTSIPRPALYYSYRLAAQLFSSIGQPRSAIEIEMRALTLGLGGVFERSDREEGEDWEMRLAPLIGNSNAVLSTLFIAQQFKHLGNDRLSQLWISFARIIERGQSGDELFEQRYASWAKRHGLDLNAQ